MENELRREIAKLWCIWNSHYITDKLFLDEIEKLIGKDELLSVWRESQNLRK